MDEKLEESAFLSRELSRMAWRLFFAYLCGGDSMRVVVNVFFFRLLPVSDVRQLGTRI